MTNTTTESCPSCGHLWLLHRSNLDAPTMPLDSPVPCYFVLPLPDEPEFHDGNDGDGACGCRALISNGKGARP